MIPAYNEEDRISATIRSLEKHIPEVKEIIVVFDGTDDTPRVARESSEKVTVLKFKRRLGKGGAIIEGFREANGGIVCFTDADGSSPWYEVKRICSLVSDKNPSVVGSRWMKSSKIIKQEPLFNRIASRIFHYIVFAFLDVKTKDTQCGLKAFRGDIAKTLAEKIRISDRTFDVALLFHLKKMGINPLEVGIEWSHNSDTRMPILSVIPMMFMTIVGLRLRHGNNVSKKLKNNLDDIYDSFNFY